MNCAKNLPSTWTVATIAEVTHVRTGKLDANAAVNDGQYPFFTCAEEISRIDSYSFDTEAVLLAGHGFFGLKWFKGKFDAYQRTYVIEPVGISGRFLYYSFLSLIPEIAKKSRGSTIKYLRLGDIEDTKLALAPDAEQARIVEKLDELLSGLDASVAELKAAQKKLARYRQSLLKAAVEGALTAEWRAERARRGKSTESGAQLLARILAERRTRWEAKQLAKFKEQGKAPPKDWEDKYPEPVQLDTTHLPELPDDWVWASLDQLVGSSSYGTSVKCSYESGGVPVLRIPNVVARSISLEDVKFATQELELEASDYLDIGDILVVRTNGSINLMGRAAEIVSALPQKCYFASYLLRLRCVEPNTVPSWISSVLAAKRGRMWIESKAASSAGQHNISLSTLLSMPIPLAPLLEQIETFQFLSIQLNCVIDQEKAVAVSLKQATAQRKNILKAAFSGQLVPQDPNDEPASILLERIRAEREKLVESRKGKTRKVRA